MLFVAAAGNDDLNNDIEPHYPSSYDCESLIAVMATDRYDNKSGFSNYGLTSVDLGAPGSSILSCEPGNQYQYLDGTSMATPHVAGACALLWSMNQAISNLEIKNILIQTVDETLPGQCVSGGRLNLYNAILETRAPWITIEPEEGTIGPGDTNDISVTFDALEMTPGIYEAEIVVISDDPFSPAIIPVALTVNPDDLAVSPDEDFEPSGTRGGPFAPACMTYTLTNNGAAAVSWTTDEIEDWVEVEPNEGVLDPCESIDVNVCITSDANLLDPNIYDQMLTFENTNSGSIKLRLVTLTVKPPDCFTESFDAEGSDLEFVSLTFSPDGSSAYYEACREKVEEFPTEPNGGVNIALGDDDFAEVILNNDANILFYGTRYDRIYVGSNGYITFGQGDTEFLVTLENHFNLPRISALFTDLTPSDNISYKELNNRISVTFQDVWLFGDKTKTNSFQVEMFYADGTIRITWLQIAPAVCVAGLSEGYGFPPNFVESNLSEYVPCRPCGDFNRDYRVDMFDLAIFVSHWLEENCSIPYWCGKTDLNFSKMVELADFAIFAENWLTVEDWWLRPISHWKFDEGEGDIAYDSAGNNHGTIYGATWTSGQIDGALDFDGVDDYVNVGTLGSFGSTLNTHTASKWVKWSHSDDWQSVYGLEQSDDQQNYHFFINRRGDNFASSPGDIAFYLREDGGSNLAGGTVGASYNDNNWHHIVLRMNDASNNDYDIFVDGVIVVTYAYSENSPDNFVDWDRDFVLGARNLQDVGVERYFNGEIDDVRFYSRALTTEEIEQLYREGLGPKASNPNPSDGATGVDPNTVLSWLPGKDADSHDVYLGTDYEDVNDADIGSPEYMGNFDVNSWDPCGVDIDTTYYWRIDEITGSSLWKGDVWSFKTWFEPNFVSWWKFDEGEGDIAYDSAGDNHGTIYGATWTSGQIDGALDFDGDGDYVNLGNDSSLKPPLPVTLSAWINLNTLESWKQIIALDEQLSKYYGMWFQATNTNTLAVSYGDGSGTSSSDRRTKTGTTALNKSNWYHVAAVVRGPTDMELYINGVDDGGLYSGTGGNLKYSSGDSFIGCHSGLINYFNGSIDDVRVYDRALSAEEVWQIYYKDLGPKASNPNPSDGATGVDPNTVLSWSPGKNADSHDVYFGTDYGDVNDANIGSPEYMGNFDVNTFDPCGLELNTTYYWRIDEVNEPNLWKGNVWSFTTLVEFDPNLVSLWEFDEGEGDIAYDSAGDNHGTIYEATWTSGQIDGALDFDGDGDYVNLGNDSSLKPALPITLSAWVRLSSLGSTQYIITSDNQTSNYYGVWFCVGNTNRLGIVYGDGGTPDSSNIRKKAGTTFLSTDTWYHVAAVIKGATDMDIYINGVDDGGSYSGTGGSLAYSSGSALIGNRHNLMDPFNGKIDDVRIYNRALNEEEIEQLYQEGL